MKMELTEGSETSANHNLTPGKYPKEHIQQTIICQHNIVYWTEYQQLHISAPGSLHNTLCCVDGLLLLLSTGNTMGKKLLMTLLWRWLLKDTYFRKLMLKILDSWTFSRA
jgi:hypothetical protein